MGGRKGGRRGVCAREWSRYVRWRELPILWELPMALYDKFLCRYGVSAGEKDSRSENAAARVACLPRANGEEGS